MDGRGRAFGIPVYLIGDLLALNLFVVGGSYYDMSVVCLPNMESRDIYCIVVTEFV